MLVAGGQQSEAWVFGGLAVGALAFFWVLAVRPLAEQILIECDVGSLCRSCLQTVEALCVWTVVALLL